MLAAVWERDWDSKPPLDPDYLWDKAGQGFSDEDERSVRSPEDVADFRLRLERLCASLEDEAELNALGHTMAYGQITSAIQSRLRLGRLWREQPELATAPIDPPIIVLGQMRSGTTRVQRLLAADPRHAGTRFCDSYDPVPRTPDIRPAKVRLALALAKRVNPWLDTMHPMRSSRTDEEIGWLAAALSPAAFQAQWRIPSYLAFSEARDPAPVYREFERMLRTDAVTKGNAERARILKCPQFTEDVPALIERFPDARILVCKRDAERVLASTLSMVASQMAFQSDACDLPRIEAEWRRKYILRERRTKAALGAADNRVASVCFDALNRDWRTAIADAYRDLGIELTDSALAAMEREQRRAGKDPHGHHRRFVEEISG